ncbi:MAG: hypothetical protein EXS31_04310 [Pedosphaera sp.]|nr:hypothetical protein [Pedosphaera sp.]
MTQQSIIFPLDQFFARSGLPLPPLEQIDRETVPEPYKTLLVHDRDMTSTLENFHQRGVHLRVVGRDVTGDQYSREVVLHLDDLEKPVEFGAICIHLNRFSEDARKAILEERFPLGHVLKDHAVLYTSRPRGFLRIASDRLINDLLKLQGAQVLYGRSNTLYDPAGEALAEIVEVLPPMPRSA